MRVAIPVWRERVSPLLDTASSFLVVDFGGEGETARREEAVLETALPQRVARIAAFGCDALICGAVSEPLAAMLVARGVRVTPWVAGGVEEVLAAFRSGSLGGAGFAMPGCTRGRGRGLRGMGRGCGGGRWTRRRR